MVSIFKIVCSVFLSIPLAIVEKTFLNFEPVLKLEIHDVLMHS